MPFSFLTLIAYESSSANGLMVNFPTTTTGVIIINGRKCFYWAKMSLISAVWVVLYPLIQLQVSCICKQYPYLLYRTLIIQEASQQQPSAHHLHLKNPNKKSQQKSFRDSRPDTIGSHTDRPTWYHENNENRPGGRSQHQSWDQSPYTHTIELHTIGATYLHFTCTRTSKNLCNCKYTSWNRDSVLTRKAVLQSRAIYSNCWLSKQGLILE